MDSNFVSHNPCPSCGSRDNLGVWDDGHKWCFGCGYWEKATSELSIQQLQQKLKRQHQLPNGDISHPAGYTNHLPDVALDWLLTYLTEEEVMAHEFGWTDWRDWLVMSIRDEENRLVLWQARSFNPEKYSRKYYTRGDAAKVIHLEGLHHEKKETVVLVEDYLSAIKVARFVTSSPLWGSSADSAKLAQLGRRFKHADIWLDKDKHLDSVKLRLKALPFFDSVRVVSTDEDPKALDHFTLKGILTNEYSN